MDLIAAAGAPIKISGAGIPGFLWLQELVVVLSCEPLELRRGVGSTAEAAFGSPWDSKTEPSTMSSQPRKSSTKDGPYWLDAVYQPLEPDIIETWCLDVEA